MGNIECKCCGARIGEESRCAYCGMQVVTIFGESGIVEIEAAKYRNSLVSRITDISVETFTYTLKNNEFVADGRKTIPIADGAGCFNRLVWAEENFAQVQGAGKRQLTIQYRFDGKPQSLSCTIDMPKTEDFWKIGVMLDERLRLTVYVGMKNQNTFAENLDLNLR